MPYKDKAAKAARDRERYKRLKAGGGHPTNPLTDDEWRALQRHVGCTEWAYTLVSKLAAVWGVPPFR